MDTDLEALLERAADPRLIPGIYNYCDRRCDRCPFTGRCLVYVDESAPRSIAEVRNANAPVYAHPMSELTHSYLRTSFELALSLEKASHANDWPSAVAEAIETIFWFGGVIGAKVHRALFAWHHRSARGIVCDEVQNDWNGCAKVARMGVAQSIAAWETILAAGDAAADSPMRRNVDMLRGIDAGLSETFPLAMEFVRPGFDEPDVAAGALTTRPPHQPRPRITDPAAL